MSDVTCTISNKNLNSTAFSLCLCLNGRRFLPANPCFLQNSDISSSVGISGSLQYSNKHYVQFVYVQGYPQRIRLQRRLYGIYNVCFKLFIIIFHCTLLSFFVKSLNKPFKVFMQDSRFNINLGSLYLKSFKSSLQSYPLRVSLQFKFHASKFNSGIHLVVISYLFNPIFAAEWFMVRRNPNCQAQKSVFKKTNIKDFNF